jgi:N-methylhydantoinase A
MIEISFDIGGTFTDVALRDDASGDTTYLKVPSTPHDYSEAVIDGINRILRETGTAASAVTNLRHATTVAANTVIERKGSRTALITTEGFRDIIHIGRSRRPETYNLYMTKPEPFIKRRDIFEVRERMTARGAVHVELDESSLEQAVGKIVEGGYASVAICLIHAYANAAHEIAVAERLLKTAPSIQISRSSLVSPQYREYERSVTTVANAYVKPIIAAYVESLAAKLGSLGLNASLRLMQSNGGLVSADLAREYPVRMVESGPAAGVLMCASIGKAEGLRNILTFDMGGTTAKLGAIDDGQPSIAPRFEIDTVNYRKASGLPLNISAIELLEIGAGGGSIAAADHGLIRVGPRSAGSIPGPICYRRGGELPTVTDANLVLGFIDPKEFNAGTMLLDVEKARNGIEEHIAKPLGIDLPAAAWGIHALATNNMERAMRVVSIEHGRDPRKYALVAFGGAGPLHATRMARNLDVPTVIIPMGAGVGSALGLLDANAKIDVSTTRLLPLARESLAGIRDIYENLGEKARQDFSVIAEGDADISRYAYMRYEGQGFELRVDLPAGQIDDKFIAAAAGAFHDAYEKKYGFCERGANVEAIDWYLVAAAKRRAAIAARSNASDALPSAIFHRDVYFPELGGFVPCPVVSRYGLGVGSTVPGPAIIQEKETSTVVLPHSTARVAATGNLIIAMNG